MNAPRERISFNGLVGLGLLIILLAALVLGALVMGALWALIGGVIVIGIIAVTLARVGVNLFSRYTEAVLKRDELRFKHDETVLKLGYLPAGSANQYIPIQIESPTDIPVSTSGQTQSTVAKYSEHALNLLALSLQWQRDTGADQTQVIPYHAARKNDYFRDVAIWMQAVQYLLINQIAMERMRGGRKEGTFVITGTVDQAYHKMLPTTPLPLT